MTDDELAALVAETAALDPHTNEGVTAMFALASKLVGEPEFATPRVVSTGRGSHGFATDFVAQRMLGVARDTSSPAAGVAWFRKTSRVSKATGGAVKALYGVRCSVPVPLTDTVVLLPFLSVPASKIRDWIIADHERANEGVSLRGFRPFPSAALYRAGTLEPVFADAKAKPSDSQASASWFDELDEAALLLALVPNAIPAEAAHWLHMDDPDVALLVQFGISRSNALDVEPPSFHVEPEIDVAQVAGLVVAYRTLSKGHRNRIALAMLRLLRGRCQGNPGNRAIDVAIALEVLFMNTDRDEHSYKIGLRAARLLQDGVAARRKVFAEVRNVYDVRSKMVHTGSANESNVDGVKRTVHDVVEAVDVVCTEAIRRFLARGSIPEDWRGIELS